MAKHRLSFYVAALVVGALSLMSPASAQVANGKVTTANPVYVNGTANGLSLDTAGNLRVLAAAGSTDILNCIYNITLPTYADGAITECQANNRGNIRMTVGDGGGGASFSAVSALNNTAISSGSSGALYTYAFGRYYNGTNWDAATGNSAGAYVQGNVASGVADTGNPVKVGCVYNTTLPTLTNGQRGDCQSGSRGSQNVTLFNPDNSNALPTRATNADAVSGSSVTGLFTTSANFEFNGNTFDREFTCPNTAVINVAAAATTQLVALAASQIIRVCGFTITADTAATTATFVYGTGANCGTGTTAITGAMRLQDEGNISQSAGSGSVFRTASANALCLTAATGAVTGFVTYAQY